MEYPVQQNLIPTLSMKPARVVHLQSCGIGFVAQYPHFERASSFCLSHKTVDQRFPDSAVSAFGPHIDLVKQKLRLGPVEMPQGVAVQLPSNRSCSVARRR